MFVGYVLYIELLRQVSDHIDGSRWITLFDAIDVIPYSPGRYWSLSWPRTSRSLSRSYCFPPRNPEAEKRSEVMFLKSYPSMAGA